MIHHVLSVCIFATAHRLTINIVLVIFIAGALSLPAIGAGFGAIVGVTLKEVQRLLEIDLLR